MEIYLFQRNLDGNILANLKAEGMIAMRLGNPRLTKQFDRCPRMDVNGAGIKGITSQSGGLKYNRFEFRKLGPWLTGDLVEMINPGSLSVPGEAVKKQCKFYFHIKSFVMKGQDYFMDGDIFINSTFQGIQPNLHQLESADCFIAVKELKNIKVKYDALQVGNSLRSRFLTPTYSRWIYDQSNPIQLLNMGVDNWNMLNSRLGLSLQNPTVQVPLNVHLDDASMVSTKMWKSASVVTIQIAGASPGFKGGESNNMILALTPTVKISLKRVFDTIVEDIVALQAGGFEAFDMFSKEVVRVKLPVTCVLGDLPAKAEVSCFTGFRADVFCSRDLYNKTTGDGFQIKRTKQTLQAQINEINIAPTMGEKKRLGVRYGLDIKNLDTVLSQLDHFDLTRDMPQDILHHYLLGWTKKTFIALQDDHLSQQDQSNIGLILDTVVLWKEYSTRTTSNAFKSIRSNIGRNIKALTQVIWYPMYLVIAFNQAAHRDLEAIVRIVFYLCKIGYMIFSETTIVWTPYMIRILRDAVNRVGSFFERRMPEILQGPKYHDLQHHLIEDLVRHGNPAGFDCSAGESKMRVQKLKNAFSNKSAPSVDVATKVMKTEIMRHILEGGVLNATGTLFAHENVLQEAKRTRSFRTILGTEEAVINIGDVSMNDWEIVRGKKYKKKTQPPQQHLNLGVPNQNMMTCRKIQTSSGALYRDGGFLMVWNGEVNLFFLHQIYKDRDGFCLAVVELMEDVSAQYPDPFLDEMQIKTWRKSDNFLLVDNFQQVWCDHK